MKPETFGAQIKRLKTEWPHSYGEAKVEILWDTFKHLPDTVFVNAISRLLYEHSGGAPSGVMIEKYVELERQRWKETQWAKAEKQIAGEPPDSAAAQKAMRECMEKIQELYAPKTVTPQTVADEYRREELKAQIRSMTDWKLRQSGEREGVD